MVPRNHKSVWGLLQLSHPYFDSLLFHSASKFEFVFNWCKGEFIHECSFTTSSTWLLKNAEWSQTTQIYPRIILWWWVYPSLVDALRLFDGWWCRLTSLFPLSTTTKSIVILLNVDQKTLPSHGLKILKMS